MIRRNIRNYKTYREEMNPYELAVMFPAVAGLFGNTPQLKVALICALVLRQPQ